MSEAPAVPRTRFDGRGFLEGKREAPDLGRFPVDDPSARSWHLEPAFPGLELGEPVTFVPSPIDDEEAFVLEHEGRLWQIRPEDGGHRKRLVLDLSDVIFHQYEAGAESFALHPDFAKSGAPGQGAVFVFYVTLRDGAMYDRVSRFRWDGEKLDRRSEQVLIEQLHEWQEEGEWGEHFGGNLVFGPDRLLYIGVGDEGGSEETENPQRLDRDLFSGILRIDPDCTPGRSHPVRRQPETGKTAGYCIPDDNPFVGEPDVLEEFWALGLRNPWGLSFDSVKHDLWVADVGKFDVEEINRVVDGGNYQWSYREGGKPGRGAVGPSGPRFGTEQKPVFTYLHGGGETSVIGGHVYRGTRHPELVGRYVFGDHGSGRIRTLLAAEGAPVPVVEEIASVSPNRLLAFERDRHGEILVLARPPHGIQRLVRAGRSGRAKAPERLSETGLFADVATLTPSRGVIPYDVNVPAFADGATSRHWIALPGDGSNAALEPLREHVLYRADTTWIAPAGTVLVEHLELPAAVEGSPPVRVETRVLVLSRGGSVYGLAYRWDPDGRDAIRIDATVEGVVPATAEGESERKWTFLGPETCTSCHHAASGWVLGLRTRQLAGEVELAEIPGRFDQLAAWSAAGLLTMAPWKTIRPEADDLRAAPLRSLDDESASLEARARSYLEVNCSACHRGVAASFSLETSTPTSVLVDRSVRNAYGIDGARLIAPGSPERSLLWVRLASEEPGLRMPPIGRERIDDAAVRVVGDWIRSLAPAGAPASDPARAPAQPARSESAISRGAPARPL